MTGQETGTVRTNVFVGEHPTVVEAFDEQRTDDAGLAVSCVGQAVRVQRWSAGWLEGTAVEDVFQRAGPPLEQVLVSCRVAVCEVLA